jgi:hypothetical protein
LIVLQHGGCVVVVPIQAKARANNQMLALDDLRQLHLVFFSKQLSILL